MILHSPIFRRFRYLFLLALILFLPGVTPGTLPAQWMVKLTVSPGLHCTEDQTVKNNLTQDLLLAPHPSDHKEKACLLNSFTEKSLKMQNSSNSQSQVPQPSLWLNAPPRMGLIGENLEEKAHFPEKLDTKYGSKFGSSFTLVDVQKSIKCPLNFSQTLKIAQTPWIEQETLSLNVYADFYSNFHSKNAIFGPNFSATDGTQVTPSSISYWKNVSFEKELLLTAITFTPTPQVVTKSSALGTGKSSSTMFSCLSTTSALPILAFNKLICDLSQNCSKEHWRQPMMGMPWSRHGVTRDLGPQNPVEINKVGFDGFDHGILPIGLPFSGCRHQLDSPVIPPSRVITLLCKFLVMQILWNAP